MARWQPGTVLVKSPSETLRRTSDWIFAVMFFEGQSKLSEAIVEYELATKINPSDASLFKDIAIRLLESIDDETSLEKGLGMAKKACELAPEDADAKRLWEFLITEANNTRKHCSRWKDLSNSE